MVVNPEAKLSQEDEFSDAQIAYMPLHAITEVLGHNGLVRRFELELTRFSPEEQAQLNKAYQWAMDLHARDRRYREPATNHILRVAIRIMHHYGVIDVNLITAALLHDSVEDHIYEITGKSDGTKEEALAAVAEQFNPDVSQLVSAVTNPEYEEGRDKLEKYQAHVAEMLEHGDPRVRILKVSDFTDNALGLIYMNAQGAAYRARRYNTLVPVFDKAINKPDTPLSPEAKAHITKQLDETRRRLALFLK
ncbi:MAG TPA: HD domain-containing protein [Candidatus Saccharimonadales bacterium]|nr:HD domain-containing protein [Candidatus Saccharimonadales bacterium]